MKINAVLFSPTHATRKITETVTQTLKSNLKAEKVTHYDLTLPGGRVAPGPVFEKDDVLVLALPVYAGRVPQIVENNLERLKGNNTKAIVVAVYGNRAYEDALLEMRDIVTQQGFEVVAAAAFVGEHSLSRRLAAGRPDLEDIDTAYAFAQKVATKLMSHNNSAPSVPGNYPYRERCPALNLAPITTEACYNCMLCAYNCPVGAIDFQDPQITDGVLCIRCCACVKGCPVEAKLFNAPAIMEKVNLLETKFMPRKEPEMFL